jgi:hypothetical protein
MAQQPTIDRSVQGGPLLESTAVGKDKGKDIVNREEEGLLGGLGRSHWRSHNSGFWHMCRADNSAGLVRQITQQPTIDRSVQGGRLLETTAVGKDNGKDNVNREEEGLLGGLGRWQGRRNVTVNSKYGNQHGYNEWTMSPQIWAILAGVTV